MNVKKLQNKYFTKTKL